MSRPLTGTLFVPGDKSVSHRAVLFPLLARGASRVRGLLRSEDLDASLRAARALGLSAERDGADQVLTGPDRLREPDDVIDCGNSGTSIRLLCGLIAPHPVYAVLTGDASLRRRPMARVLDPLRALGARADARDGGRLPPVTIRGGPLQSGAVDLPIASAQVKSAVLLAGLLAGVKVREPARSRDHTERLLRAMGADLVEEADGWLALRPSALSAVDVDVPGDLSAAAFPLVAASLIPGSDLLLPRVGVNPTRAGVLDALRAMGATIEVVPVPSAGGEPMADLHVRHAPLHATRIDGDLALRALDELPVLAVAAAFAEGTTVIADAAELRVKESDRIARVCEGLRALGVAAEERPDGMVVPGGRPRGPAVVDATHDHRIAMAFAVADRAMGGGIELRGRDAVASSWPMFFEDLAAR